MSCDKIIFAKGQKFEESHSEMMEDDFELRMFLTLWHDNSRCLAHLMKIVYGLELLEHLLHSSDLSHSDFYTFGFIKEFLGGKKLDFSDELILK